VTPARAEAGFLLVRVAGRSVGLPLSQVAQVVELGEVHGVPVVERAVRGVTAVQGRMVPLVHLGSLLEGRSCPPEPATVGVVVVVDGRRVCLEVEDVEILVHASTLPVPPGEVLPWAIGVARHGDTLVPILNVPALSSRLLEVA
jgi:chemotaxis signal transduction protein